MPWCMVVPDLSPKVSIEHNISNARRCFFTMGSKGVFQGIANPLSSKAILDSCVMPTCLSGCENWLLNDVLLSTLEAFQGFVGCRSLHLSRFRSHLIPRIVLDLPSMRARILSAKLGFLSRISTPDNNTLSSLAFRRLLSNHMQRDRSGPTVSLPARGVHHRLYIGCSIYRGL